MSVMRKYIKKTNSVKIKNKGQCKIYKVHKILFHENYMTSALWEECGKHNDTHTKNLLDKNKIQSYPATHENTSTSLSYSFEG